jgi:hypothetical protein
MPFLTTLGFAASAAGAVKGLIGGSKMASDARKGFQNFQYQDLSVSAFDDSKPSLGVEREAMKRLGEQRAGMYEVGQGMSGSEAMAFLSAGEEQIGQKEIDLLGLMQKEESRIQQLQAQDFQQRRAMQEQRDMQELQSLQQQLYAGEQMQASALQGLGETAMAAGLGKMQLETQGGKNPLVKKSLKETDLGGLLLGKKGTQGGGLIGGFGSGKGLLGLLGKGLTGKRGGKGGILGFIKGLLPF